MLHKFFIHTALFCSLITGFIYTSDKNPFHNDCGAYTTADTESSNLLTYVSRNLAYIAYTPYKEHSASLLAVKRYIHDALVPNVPFIKTLANLITVLQPMEYDIQQNAPEMHLAVAYFSDNKLFAIVRGNCGLYHVKNAKCTVPVCAETITADYRRNAKPKNTEFVSLCGIQDWNKGDNLLMYTPNIERRICPETIFTEFIKKYDCSSASQFSYLLLLHASAPHMSLKTQEECDAAEKHAKKDAACIVIKKIV